MSKSPMELPETRTALSQNDRHEDRGNPMTGDRDERRTAAGWAAMPPQVSAQVEQLLGSPVADAISQPGGFSEGMAVRVHLANGRRAFVKAASSLVDPAAADFHRREIAVSQRLPGEVPAARLLDAYDDGTWVVLVFEEIPGRLPAQPWQPDELTRVLAAVTDMAEVLTPSPVDEAILSKPRLGDGWR
ncbi:hypothetical protein ACFYO2_39900 [Streptomyces sp. NPDC006602]|uniref:hypothetical protein n=1 Tax=Streptomyces sp. NPDC006602 TaxID=3364751 RepID=UPI0036A469AC